MRIFRTPCVALLIYLFAACSSREIITERDNNFDFTRFDTYKMADKEEGGEKAEIIRRAIDKEMALKGEGKNEIYFDFIINWQYDNTILKIEIIDPVSSQVVWSGKTTEKVDPLPEEINNAVEKILSAYPPPQPAAFKGN